MKNPAYIRRKNGYTVTKHAGSESDEARTLTTTVLKGRVKTPWKTVCAPSPPLTASPTISTFSGAPVAASVNRTPADAGLTFLLNDTAAPSTMNGSDASGVKTLSTMPAFAAAKENEQIKNPAARKNAA